MGKNNMPSAEYYIQALEGSNKTTEKAIRSAIRELGLFDECRVLDIPCGIGSHALWMLEENPSIIITGIDVSEEHLEYARNLVQQKEGQKQTVFIKKDINKLDFSDNSFDFIWCCDGLWQGPAEMGCVSTEPYNILASMSRITKPGGKIAVLFWSYQKLLPGYPMLETALNATVSANRPFIPGANPELHFMRTPLWLKKTGLVNIKTQTFPADIQGPLNIQAKNYLQMFFNMFWGRAEKEVTPEVWKQYRELTSPDFGDYILGRDDYAGFITYTMFSGEVKK